VSLYDIGSAFHTASLLLHFPPMRSAPDFSTPAFSVAPFSIQREMQGESDRWRQASHIGSVMGAAALFTAVFKGSWKCYDFDICNSRNVVCTTTVL